MDIPDPIAEAIRGRRILLAGCSGMVGSRLHAALRGLGAETLQLVREPGPGPGKAHWDPAAGKLSPTVLEGIDTVVNLAGASILCRWTAANKTVIHDSRVQSTALLAKRIAACDPPPALITASAVGYYGSGTDEALDEESPPGDDFLAQVCRDWEAAAAPAADAGARVVRLRLGVVLDPAGGALGRAITPFRLCLGGRLGSGRQVVSWIAWPDLVQILLRAIVDPGLAGPINATAPLPVSNREFTRALGQALHRPTPFPVPGFAIRLLVGAEMARCILLQGQKVLPQRLTEAGFQYQYVDIDAALAGVLAQAQ